MLRKIFVLIVTVFPSSVSAQNSSGSYKNQIKFSPFRIVDVFNPGIEISYERLHSEKFSTQLSYAFDKDIFGFPYKDFRGYRFSVEEKYFFKSLTKGRKYYSVDLVLNDNKYNGETYYQDSVLDTMEKEHYLIHRKNFSVNIKYGKQVLLNRFIIDLSIGAGIKWRNVTLYNVHPLPRQKGIDVSASLRTPGKDVTINLL